MHKAKAIKIHRGLFYFILALGTTVHAAATLDQNHSGSSSLMNDLYGGRLHAQTFEAGITGTLDGVSLVLRHEGEHPLEDILVEIRSVTNGVPDEKSLASAYFDTSVLTSEFRGYRVSFDGPDPKIVKGQAFAIVVSSDQEWHRNRRASWAGESGNPYAEGKWQFYDTTQSEWTTKDYDGFFRTYVEPLSSSAPISLSLWSQSDGAVEIDYDGIIQSSSDLNEWTDVYPQPRSPFTIEKSALNSAVFFRSRNASE